MSSTALWMDVAILRGLESGRPPEVRLVDDPVSLRLLPGVWRVLIRLLEKTGVADFVLARRERALPGVIANLLCRTRYVDDVLRSALEDGVEQVVVLGAGFDTRPYRIPGVETVPVFEVDHPAAQDAKRRALERASMGRPARLALVPVDFERDDLGAALAAAGLRRGVRTLFVWEGVTQYISRRAIDDTLEYVGKVGGRGSRVVFSYVRREVIAGGGASAVDRRIMARAERGGAPWITGLDPGEVRAMLDRHGLALVEEVGGEEYRRRYLVPAGRELATLPAERVVVAEVRDARPDGKEIAP